MLRFLILIFMLSGFSGLIYESIWTHYLKLFLGHAAYAQTLVLVIFLGGLAAGAAISARKVDGWSDLILKYAIIEGAVGVIALAFDPVYVLVTNYAFDHILPGMAGSELAIQSVKYSIASLLILPQSVLLGMTFPLMVGGVLRVFPGENRNISMFYFANSFGAVLGVLASAFLFIELFGLPGTIKLAGLLNLLIALAVWLAVRRSEMSSDAALQSNNRESMQSGFTPVELSLLTIAMLTGFSSFLYEIGWIRMLTLVMGSSTHSFEVMLAVFIGGLAFGSLWLSRHENMIARPWRMLAIAQIVMGLGALISIWVYISSFDMMAWLLQTIFRNDDTYSLYLLFCGLLAILIMLPATFFAGMTLPLATQLILKSRSGQRGVGAIYAVNTFGAIAAIALATHVLMPTIGLKNIILAGAVIDLVLGVIIFWYAGRSEMKGDSKAMPAFVAVLVVVAGMVALSSDWDVRKLSSGVFRAGAILMDSEVVSHVDGKTATITVKEQEELNGDRFRTLMTNGKPDASIMLTEGADRTSDEATQLFTGVFPMLLKPDAQRVAVIGMGSGVSSSAVLLSDKVEVLDTIEIEQAIIDAADMFRPDADLVFDDPRSTIYVDDAKTFFSVQQQNYDIIISEPSNPWVSGISTLFSQEFYAHVKQYLNDDGLLAQWIQLYEITPELVALILNALSQEFEDYHIYSTNNQNILIVASKSGKVSEVPDHIFDGELMLSTLKTYGVTSAHDVNARFLGARDYLDGYFRTFSELSNSDYYPLLDMGAPRARFSRHNAAILVRFQEENAFPVFRLLGQREVDPARVNYSQHEPETLDYYNALALYKQYVSDNDADLVMNLDGNLKHRYELKAVIDRLQEECISAIRVPLDANLYGLIKLTMPYLDNARMGQMLDAIESQGCVGEGKGSEMFSLYRSITSMDWGRANALSEKLLAEGATVGEQQKRFVMAAYLYSGSQLDGFDPQAGWTRFSDGISKIDSVLKILLVNTIK